MHFIRRRGWEIAEREATPEGVFLNRRQWVVGAGAIGGALATGAASAQEKDPSADLYPAKRNEKYVLDRDVTPEQINANYNNFYEFGSYKRVAAEAQALKTRPWTVKIGGMVEKPVEIGIDDIVRKMKIEERLYRHRCVEAWSMAVPWSGFPLKDLLALANPLGSAKYVEFKTFHDPKSAPGQRQTWYPWPYTEGLTIEEAGNELAFLVTGAYGKPLLKQFGAPIRLALPWKYGFKHIKSIVQITLTDKRPKSYWEALQDSEYGFWANVNPAVPHPRWSQASEEVLGAGKRVPTQIFNGYGEYVAQLYKGLENERLFV
ncbi:protein-methionine-sulfoxide reductase catalytic subunit MsrP [Terrarubrum flagellatum]|uniref:protein-methionine-sulfoxide reductase catalytic subunit MsrP n=1 Tax=Terrirubrum flagellatum TaxID=2895980 RepID=UPI0031455114